MDRTSGSFTAPTYIGDLIYEETSVSDGHVFGRSVQPCYGLNPYVACLGEKQEFSYVLGPKTESISVGSNIVNVPVFKPVTNLKIKRDYLPGIPLKKEAVRAGVRYKLEMCGAQQNSEYYTPEKLESMGLCYNHTTLASIAGSSIAARINNELLSDSSLMGFTDGFSVLNFIAELREVRDLPKLLTRWTKSDKDISDKYLGFSFGVLPFASDVTSITNRLGKLGPSIDRWNRDAATSRVLNAHRNIPFSPKGKNVGTEKDPVYKTEFSQLVITYWPGPVQVPVYHSHECRQKIKLLMHVYFVPHNLDEGLFDDLKREIWGIDKPVTALWNAIPFSFVVDWFTNIGELITQLESTQPLLKVKLLSAGYSVKVVTEHTCKAGQYPGSDDLGTTTQKYEYYARVPVTPSSVVSAGTYYGPLRFKQITPGQTVLGSALLHQLLR